MMNNDAMLEMLEMLPEEMVKGLGYDRLGSPGGYITSTVYGLIGPALMLVFGIGFGARLIAGEEEAGTLELELTAPVERGRLYAERLAALWVALVALSIVVGLATQTLVLVLGMEVPLSNVLAGTLTLGLLLIGMSTVAFAAGAALGRRGAALGIGAALAVGGYVLNAIAQIIDAQWMTMISPFAWYLDPNPLENGLDVVSAIKLLAVTPIAAVAGWLRFRQRDLMV